MSVNIPCPEFLIREYGFKKRDGCPDTGLNCRAIKSAIGVMYFKMAGYTRENDEKLLIFPLGKYFIGISQDSEAYTPDITARVEKILRVVTGKTQDTEKTAP